MEAIAITVVTPMTTPRIVSAERSLLARRESKAIATPSPTLRMPGRESTRSLIGAEGRDRIEPGGSRGGEDAEDHAGAAAQSQRHGHRPERDAGRQRREGGHRRRQPPAGQYALQPAQGGEHDRLDEELSPDVAPGGA